MSRWPICFLMTAFFLTLAVSPLGVATARAADAATILQQVEGSWPDWLPKPDQCPADLMPAHETVFNFSIERCSAETAQCLDRCRAGDAADCYATALVFKKVKDTQLIDALFLRACGLGLVSGCTNRAAGMDMASDGHACAIRTYEKACDLNDPWACTMIGFHLVRGTGVEKDYARAKNALSKSCRYGDDDDACRGAKRLLKEIGD
jgi:hypothetical protein